MNNQAAAQKIVDRIVDLIEKGQPLPWVKPWSTDTNTVTVINGVKTVTIHHHCWNRRGTPYKGVNTYLPHGEYITWNQCQAEGGKVKKGAKAWPVVYWNFKKIEEQDPITGETKEKKIPLLKLYQVFNLKDCEGIEQKHNPKPTVVEIPIIHTETKNPDDVPLNTAAEAIIDDYISRAGNGFHVVKNKVGDRAFYAPALDYVQVPHRSQFNDESEYYSTMFHELGHSTGHSSRLKRFGDSDTSAAFGTQTYSKEELIAEATAATILNAIGLENGNSFRNSAAYIKGWSSSIKKDPMMYITAATKAQAAVDLILGTPAEA